MDKISCDVCLDLIPLVNDNIASKDSHELVIKHIENCESCRKLYNIGSLEEAKMDDKRVISNMKKEIYFAGLITIIFGAILGVVLFDGMGMFYNILIMPMIGGLGYFLLRGKSFY